MSYLDDENSPYSLKAIIPGIAGFLLFFLGNLFIHPAFGFIGMILGIGVGLGAIVGAKFDTKKSGFTILFWSNLVTWLIPIVGIFTGTVALVGGNKRETKRPLYLVLGAIGLGLSLVNALFGFWLRSKGV